MEVTFESPQRALAPGQVIAIYDGERLLGGVFFTSLLFPDGPTYLLRRCFQLDFTLALSHKVNAFPYLPMRLRLSNYNEEKASVQGRRNTSQDEGET